MSHSLWIMSSKGLGADSISLFTLPVSRLQASSLVPSCERTGQSIIFCRVSVGGMDMCPYCPYRFTWENVIPNPSTLLAPVTTTGHSNGPFPGRPAFCCSFIPLSVIKGSQGELRCRERGVGLRIGFHMSHWGLLTAKLRAFSWPGGCV